MIDPSTRRKIITDLKSGLSYQSIMDRHGVRRTQVAHIVEAEKLGRKRVSDHDLQTIAKLAEKNARTVDISEDLDLSIYQVVYSLRKLGLNRKQCRPKQIKS